MADDDTLEKRPIVGYKHLSIDRFEYRFESPVGAWKARLDEKAWGKNRNLLPYFSIPSTDEKFALSVFWTNGYGPERGVINFKSNAEPGELFELETAKTRTGTVKLVHAVKLPEESTPGIAPESDVTP